MKLLGANGGTYHAAFQFSKFVKGQPRSTVCALHAPNGAISMGTTTCSVLDPFVRTAGRKLALARAMRSAGLSRAERAALWKSYLVQTGVLQAVVAPTAPAAP